MSAALYNHEPEAYNEKGQMEKEQSARENPEDGHLRPVIADAFALREGEEGEDFKTLGWFKAGLVITCEVRRLFKVEARRRLRPLQGGRRLVSSDSPSPYAH